MLAPMSINVPGPRHGCFTCGAPWSDGRWTWGCAECGGASMTMPCGHCMGTCGSLFNRAAMDSNDSGRAHLFGSCKAPGELREKVLRWFELERVAKALAPPLVQLRAELAGWSSEHAWAERPNGPPVLQVLLDGLKERGFSPSARALAHAVFGWGAPDGAGLPRLKLRGYWQSAGALVELELLPGEPIPSRPKPTRVARVTLLVASGPSWLSDRRGEEVPCAGADALLLGRRYLGVLLPVNMVPGLLLDEYLELPPERAAALIDWHRHLVAQGEPPRRR